MAFLIGGANSAVSGYDIDNSLRFNDGDSAYLGIDYSASATNRKKWTASFWVKRGVIDPSGSHQYIFGFDGSGNIEEYVQFESSTGYLQFDSRNASGGSSDVYIRTKMLFRDASAWYHIVIAADSTDATEGNRYKVYVNGVQQDLTASTAVPEDYEFFFNETTGTKKIGVAFTSNFYDGYLSEFHFVDGTQYAASVFGETNEDSGIWVPKDCKSDITYGNNGFFLEFKGTGTSQDASGIGADTSGNDNHWAVTNLAATDITTDTPTNNWCTLNPLINSAEDGAISEGNTKLVSGSSSWGHKLGTMGVTNGKWYYEAKVTSSTGAHYVGWQDVQPTQVQLAANPQSDSSGTTIWYTNTANDTTGHLRKNDTDDTAVSNAAIANGEIVGIALDLDSGTKTITIYKDGSAVDSDNTIASGNTGTLVPFIANATSGASIEVNFGNPPYANSSDAADENGYGAFEYAPPSGYYALCTKNLAEFG